MEDIYVEEDVYREEDVEKKKLKKFRNFGE